MTGRALERPVFTHDKLAVAVKLDGVSTDIMDNIISQYIWFSTAPSSKPYTRILIKLGFLHYDHPKYLDQHDSCLHAAADLAAHQKAFSVILKGPYFYLSHQTLRKKANSIKYLIESE
jgi:hypothetical protein